MISLVEHPELEWIGRLNYLTARNEEIQVENYTRDLIWSLAKRHYDNIPMPSEIWTNKNKVDRRSGKQIVSDLINKLGGE